MNIHTGFATETLEPANAALADDAPDRQRHLLAIHAIAEELQRPFDEVAAHYEQVLAELIDKVSVTDYLPLFVAKKVRQIFRQRHH